MGNKHRRTRGAGLLLAVAGIVMFAAGPAGAATGWTVLPTPASSASQNAVSCAGSGSCLSVSKNGAALKYSNGTWKAVATPAGAVMLGVACPTSTYCIAVGQVRKGTSGATSAAAWRWNGSAFTAQTVYNPASADNGLNGIKCASATSCEAVGEHGTSTTVYPLAEVWNGTAWADQSTSGAPAGSLYSVACESPGTCEAVGKAPNSTSGSNALAMTLSGSKWISQSTPTLPNGYGSPPGSYGWYLDSVSCYSAGCVAVGQQSYCACSPESSGDLLLSEVWNGSTWSLLGQEGQGDPQPGPLSQPPSAEGWTAVHCLSASSCTAVGYWTLDNEAQPYYTLVSSWNGSQWRQVTAPSPGSNTYGPAALNSLACTSGGSVCTAVGEQTNSSGNLTALAERS
jgi:hypothetical protein